MRPRRDEFSIPAETRYLNCAYMSPLPRAVEEAGIDGVRGKRDPSRIEARHFFEASDRARAQFAALIGADAAGVAIVPGVSYGMEVIARNLPEAGPDRTYVVLADQFPANVYPWRALAGRAGGAVRTVARPAGEEDWTDRVLDAIDASTALVALPQAHWTDGALLDLRRVGARARAVGAALVIDGTQSIGVLDFVVSEIEADAVACAGYKWLLGPYSLGYLWLGERFRSGTPLEQTWIGRAGSEDFRALVDYRTDLRDDASRFDVAERSNFALMPMAIAALDYLETLGVPAVRAHCAELTARIADECAAIGAAPAPGPRADHIVGLRLGEDADGARVFEHLRARRIHVSRRGNALRVSPHVYNGHDDVDALLGALAEVLAA
jgi:selenocysteine lyase/cysteine desulfurase